MQRIEVDNLIIGSGFGGAVAALRLGQARQANPEAVGSVALVERGRQIRDPQELPPLLTTDRRQRWRTRSHPLSPLLPRTPRRDRNFPGLLERFTTYMGADVVCGAAYGGGSVVYGGMMLQPEPGDFELIFGDSRLGPGLPPAELTRLRLDSPGMASFYRRVRNEMAQSHDPQTGSSIDPGWRPGAFGHITDIVADLAPATRLAYQQRFAGHIRFRRDALESGRGGDLRKLGTAVNWQVIRDELEGSTIAAATAGESVMGFRSGAMMSLDKNYLFRAQHEYGVKVHTTTIVERLIWSPKNRTHLVVCRYIGEDGEDSNQLAFVAKRVYVCAGSMNSARLLLDAKARGNYNQMHNAVGQDWGGNGDALYRRRSRLPTSFDFIAILEAMKNRAPLTPIDDPSFVAGASLKFLGRWRQASPPTAALYKRVGGEPLHLVHTGGTATHPYELPHLAMSIPEHLGSLRLGRGRRLQIHWGRDVAPDQRRLARNELKAMALDLRGRPAMMLPLPGKATYHPLGGMRLGRACDWYGRVRGAEGLYVLDGALFPGHTAAANPAWSIAALAERCIETVIREDLT